VSLLGIALSVAAAWRLAATPQPLAITAALVAIINVVCAIVGLLARGRETAAPRALTALQHVTTALAGFFLFVSFSLA